MSKFNSFFLILNLINKEKRLRSIFSLLQWMYYLQIGALLSPKFNVKQVWKPPWISKNISFGILFFWGPFKIVFRNPSKPSIYRSRNQLYSSSSSSSSSSLIGVEACLLIPLHTSTCKINLLCKRFLENYKSSKFSSSKNLMILFKVWSLRSFSSRKPFQKWVSLNLA